MQPVKIDTCLLCKQEIRDAYWLYVWKKESGYCCRGCGEAIHVAGYKVLRSLTDILTSRGLKLIDSKEKFGYYRLSLMADNQYQKDTAVALFKDATKRFPEFAFEFSVSYYEAVY